MNGINMKNIEELNEHYLKYNNEIKKEILNLNRMQAELKSNFSLAEEIIFNLKSILPKLHLVIDTFTVSYPVKEGLIPGSLLYLHLLSDGNFKYLDFKGYYANGTSKNYRQAEKIATNISEIIEKNLFNYCKYNKTKKFKCLINPLSLELHSDYNKGEILLSISCVDQVDQV